MKLDVPTRQPNPASFTVGFLALLETFRGGALLAEGDAALTELVTAIMATGEGGTLTMELKFKMNKAGQVELQPGFKLKKPRRSLPLGIFYGTEDGGLTRRDPNQPDLLDDFPNR